MRVYMKQLAILLCGAIAISFLLINLPSATKQGEFHARSLRSPSSLPRRQPPAATTTRQTVPCRPADDNKPAPVQWDTGANSCIPVDYVNFERHIDKSLIASITLKLDEYKSLRHRDVAECQLNKTLGDYWRSKKNANGAMTDDVPSQKSMIDSWERFYNDIGSCDMYRSETIVRSLLDDLNKLPIEHVEIMEGGTQIKLVLTFSNGKKAVFKPMRYGRGYETDPNHFYFSDFERHNAEIATFHLDKVLGYRRAVPTVGRIVDMENELKNNAATDLRKTFFVSPAKNLCFVGKCDYYCDTTHAICGLPNKKEGSVQVFLPDEESASRSHNRSPYRRTYSKKTQLATWQKEDDYCETNVKTEAEFAHGRLLLDLIDMHIMDFLIGNQDRHHYESFSIFDDYSAYPIHMDNGRAFGRTDIDDESILKPLVQCCVIRPSTLTTLLGYYSDSGKSLTQSLHESMMSDPVAPILAQKHYKAMERRLHIVISAIDTCLRSNPNVTNVIRNSYDNLDGTKAPKKEESEEDGLTPALNAKKEVDI